MLNLNPEGLSTISLYGTIGDEWDGVTAKDIREALADLPHGSQLQVHIHSPGGSVFEGIAIAGIFADYETTMVVDGIAASMASVIALSGNRLEMAEGSALMIHNPWSIVAGDADEMRKQADLLDQIQSQLIEKYKGRLGNDEEQIKSMLAQETWIFSGEAVELGYADAERKAFKTVALFNVTEVQLPEEKRERIAAMLKPVGEFEKGAFATARKSAEEAKAAKERAIAAEKALEEYRETAEAQAAEAQAEIKKLSIELQDATNKYEKHVANSKYGVIPPEKLQDAGPVSNNYYERYQAIQNAAERRKFFAENKSQILQDQLKLS